MYSYQTDSAFQTDLDSRNRLSEPSEAGPEADRYSLTGRANFAAAAPWAGSAAAALED